MPTIPFIEDGSSQGQSKDVSAVRLVNLYSQRDAGAKSTPVLYPVPGSTERVDFADYGEASTSRGRAIYFTSTSRLFTWMGGNLYEVSGNGTAVLRATFTSSTDYISVADNGYWMVFADGQLLYRYALRTNTLSTYSIYFANP